MASTALEALTVELLGDIGQVHNEVKALREVLPETTQSLSEQTEKLLAATERLREGQVDIILKINAAVNANVHSATAKAVEAAKVDIRSAAVDAAKLSVGDEIRQVVGTLKDAEIYIKKSKRFGITFAMMLIASCLGASVMFVILDIIYLK